MLKFFKRPDGRSLAKINIVTKYFDAWSRIMVNNTRGDRIIYLDLFCGPGRYNDGTFSTPIKILHQCVNDKRLSDKVLLVFNDCNLEYVENLEQIINATEGLDNLKFKPELLNVMVTPITAKQFASKQLAPCFSFIDPWGYKGFCLELVDALVKDWGCDCIFFFNYSRIKGALNNPKVSKIMEEIFGEQLVRIKDLLSKAQTAKDRENILINEIVHRYRNKGHYVLPFRFRHRDRRDTSHYLIYVTAHHRGYDIMKEIMAKESSYAGQGVPSYEYIPVEDEQLSFLHSLSRPLDDLKQILLTEFTGRSLLMIDIYNEHNIDKPYLKKNYKAVLLELEQEGKIRTIPSADKRRKNTFGDSVRVIFY